MESLKETLPGGLADAAISVPGVGAIIQLVTSKFGIDVGSLMSIYLLLFGLYQGVVFLYNQGHHYLLNYGTSAIRIDDDDDLYAQFVSWISEQRMTALSRDLKASSRKPRARSDDSDSDSEPDSDDDDDVLDDSGVFNYDKWTGTNPVYYEPNIGDNHFEHNGTRFQFTKDMQENKYAERIEYHLIIRCMGRSTQPIKELIDHVRTWSSRKRKSTTEIYRADPRHHGYWQIQSTRASRPITTVTLDQVQKDGVVADVNEYLHPATARWYAARGIPHRRGYLFHGPPGTGKTSLSFALAGIFGLTIYCVSLSEPEMGEAELAGLFAILPNRCVVLLEDIDSAGIRREGGAMNSVEPEAADNDEAEKAAKQVKEKDAEETKKVEDAKKAEDKKVEQTVLEKKKRSLGRRLTRSLRSQKNSKTDSETTTLVSKDDASEVNTTVESLPDIKPAPVIQTAIQDQPTKSKISLAGLLNIIDGAASNEGRVLIMTTNCPEKLDPALIRPGRVDVQIKFTLATHAQMQEIFCRMYSRDTDATATNSKTPSAPSTTTSPNPDNEEKKIKEDGKTGTSTTTTTTLLKPRFATLPAAQLHDMAKQFADSLPEHTFSPAEIQGYLLVRKTDPQGAVDGVAAWRDGVLEARRKNKKVVDLE